MKNASEKLHYELLHDKLIVESENILQLLEDVYYFMGKDIYDTSTKKQLDKLENVYYDVQKDEFHRFPKIYTYVSTPPTTYCEVKKINLIAWWLSFFYNSEDRALGYFYD